mgnify:CR=1 FL=1
MARPKPTLIMEHVDQTTYNSEQVLAADAIYAVYYQGKPINLRSASHIKDYPGPKYKKVSFSNSGHAFNLAERLNKKFKTKEFTVVKLVVGETITEKTNT